MILPDWYVPDSIVGRMALLDYPERKKRDPLLNFSWPGEPHRQACRYHAQGLITLLRGSNDSAKTNTGAATMVATLRGLKELDGEKLPEVDLPATWLVIVQTYKQQVEASQAAVFRWIGEHPHRVTWLPGEKAERIWIATPACTHGTGKSCSTCSTITFHCCESPSVTGAKVDGIWSDEPCTEDIWDEALNRGKATRRLYVLLTGTPIDRSYWKWMPEFWAGTERNPKLGRVEVRATMDDNKFLSPEVKEQKIAQRVGSQLEAARLKGDYVDMAGDCPFQPPSLLEGWMRRAKEMRPSGPKIIDVPIYAERSAADAMQKQRVIVRVEIFYDPEPDEQYVGVLDPSLFLFVENNGYVSPVSLSRSRVRHDPAGLHIYSRRRPRLCVRFSGFTGAYGLGHLGAEMGRRYNMAVLDPELNIGDSVIRGLRDAKYFKLNPGDWHPSQPGYTAPIYGFKTNIINRGQMTDSIQQALLEDSVLVESEECIRNLMRITVQKTEAGKDKWEASHGSHDEDMICMGRALYLMAANRLPPLPRVDRTGMFERTHGVILRNRETVESGIRWGPQ